MITNNTIKERWSKHWQNKANLEESSSFLGVFLRKQRFYILSNMLNNFSQDLSIIDMGCGSGSTLNLIRSLGFKNSIGIDFIEHSIKRCTEFGYVENKDVFLMDAKKTKFPDQHFDIVFSEGLWEHFKDPRLYMIEAARISKQAIVVIQPNHFSLFGRLMQIGWNIFLKEKGGVKEYSFTLGYFKEFLRMYGFKFIKSKSTILNEQALMQFERKKEVK